MTRDPLLDGTAPDIMVDDTAVEPAAGSQWQRVNIYGGYGPSLYKLEPSGRSEPALPLQRQARRPIYRLHILQQARRHVETSQLTVSDGANLNRITLDYDAITIHGQTAGEWISLGEYDLRADTPAYVEFDNGGDVSGTLYADAVLVVPKK